MEQATQAINKFLFNSAYKQNFKLGSILDVKQVSNRILKQLREDLAASQTVYVKRLNADLIEFESTQRDHIDRMKNMTKEEIIRLVGQLKEEIMALRTNEIFMKKVADQIKAIRMALSLCNFQCFFANYESNGQSGFDGKDLPQKLLKIVEELTESVSREI